MKQTLAAIFGWCTMLKDAVEVSAVSGYDFAVVVCGMLGCITRFAHNLAALR